MVLEGSDEAALVQRVTVAVTAFEFRRRSQWHGPDSEAGVNKGLQFAGAHWQPVRLNLASEEAFRPTTSHSRFDATPKTLSHGMCKGVLNKLCRTVTHLVGLPTVAWWFTAMVVVALGSPHARAQAVYTDILPPERDDFGVFWVSTVDEDSKMWLPTEAHFGDRIQLHIKDLWKWWKRCKERKLIAEDTTLERFTNNLALIVDGVPLVDVKPERVVEWVPAFPYHRIIDPVSERDRKDPGKNQSPENVKKAGEIWTEWHDRRMKWEAEVLKAEEMNKKLEAERKVAALAQSPPPPVQGKEPPGSSPAPMRMEVDPFDGTYYLIEFTLRRTDQNQSSWSRVFSYPKFREGRVAKRMNLSVAFPRSDAGYSEMVSWVRSPGSDNKADLPREAFVLVIANKTGLFTALAFFAFSFILILAMLRSPGLLRESAAPLRPDGLQPFSLARVQMAFWLYLIVPAYLLLWLIVGRTDVLNSTATILLGITSATALGASLIGRGEEDRRKADALTVEDVDAIHPRLWHRLSKPGHLFSRLPLRVNWRIRVLEGMLEDPNLSPERRALISGRVDALKEALEYAKTRAPIRFVLDLVSEKGAPNFARFQMLVWTTVLGVVFWTEVYSKLQMPTFDTSLLALLGISAGTYLGFKNHPAPKAPSA